MTTKKVKKKAVIENELFRVWPCHIPDHWHLKRLRELTPDDFCTGQWRVHVHDTRMKGGTVVASRVLTLRDELAKCLMPWNISIRGETYQPPRHVQVEAHDYVRVCSRQAPYDYRGIKRDDEKGRCNKRHSVEEDLRWYVDVHRDTLIDLTVREINYGISFTVELLNKEYERAVVLSMTGPDTEWVDEIAGEAAEEAKKAVQDLKVKLKGACVLLRKVRNQAALRTMEERDWTFEMPDGKTYQIAPKIARNLKVTYQNDKAFERKRFPR